MKEIIDERKIREGRVMRMKMSFLALGCLAAVLALSGCGGSESKVATKEEKKSARTEKKEKASTAKPERTPVLTAKEEAVTTDGRAIFGQLVLTSPTELRLYIEPTFPGNRRASIRATVTVDGGSTVPTPFYPAPSMDYLVATLIDEVKPPVSVTLLLSADGYAEAEVKATVSAMMTSNEKEKDDVPAQASNPREYTQLISKELGRLRQAVEVGRLAAAPKIAKHLLDAVSGLALTTGEKAEVALMPAQTLLNDAVTSLSRAHESGSRDEAVSVLAEIEKVIEKDVKPFFKSE